MSSLPPDHLLGVARAFRPIPTASGSLFFASDMPGFGQTYRLDGPDRFPIRIGLTQDRMLPVAETSFGLLVRLDVGGNETWQLGLLQPGAGLRLVTADSRAIHREPALTPDGRHVAVACNPNGQSDWVLGLIDLETGAFEKQLDRGGWWSWLGWSPDGRTAAVAEMVQTRSLHNRAYLLEPGAELRPVLSGALMVADVTWAGDRLLALTDLDREFVGLVELDPACPDGPAAVRRRLVDEEHDVLAVVPDPSG